MSAGGGRYTLTNIYVVPSTCPLSIINLPALSEIKDSNLKWRGFLIITVTPGVF